MSDEFDFIKAFADVDILAVEAVGMVVGRTIASAYNGMIAAGLTEGQADHIVRTVVSELFRSLRP